MKKPVKIFWRVFFICSGLGILLIFLADWGVFGKMPSMDELQNPTSLLASQLYADDGTLMGKYYIEDRVSVEYKDISKHVINALVSTEDERFFDHSGIDGKSMGRAFATLGRGGGGSTLTMQTAKNLFTVNWSTSNIMLRMLQKLKECIIAVKLERNFTKEEIITLYLNTVPFGENVYGIQSAAKTFFSKDAANLTVDEAAVLVGMLKGGIYNPRRFPKQAFNRRNVVLGQMVRNNFLSESEFTLLKDKPIALNYKKLDEVTGLAPYFRMEVGEDMKKWCEAHVNPATGKPYNLYKDGLKIYTTINARMQLYAEEAVAKHISYMQKILNAQGNIKSGSVWKEHTNILEAAMHQSDRWKLSLKAGMHEDEIRKSFSVKVPMKIFAWNNKREKDTIMTPIDSIKYCHQLLEAGLMAMDPFTGEVKAWVGGINFKTFKYDHVNINTTRQTGSSIKPLLYSLAVENGGFTPGTPVEDVQQEFEGFGMVPATATSCTGKTMPMSEALAMSRNCATAYIMKQLGSKGNDGAQKFVEFLKNCGITTKVDPYPSIALGSAELSLTEMMQAYSMFPGSGFTTKPIYLSRIEDRNGNILQVFLSQRKEVISDVAAYAVTQMMEGVVKFGTGRRMKSFGITANVAGKTGTTNDNSDAWFIGATPQLLCGVWTGCDDRFIRFNSTEIGQGSSVAMPVWAYFYDKCSHDKSLGLDNKADFVRPENVLSDSGYNWTIQAPTVPVVEDGGSGAAHDYTDTIPKLLKPEDLSPESQLPTDQKKPGNGTGNNPGNKKDTTQVPKAVMPPKKD
jgi:penicillin-binding protein 1A